MSLARASLRSFLSTANAALSTAIQKSSPVTFIIGNESADLDSLCSAVVLAYIRTYSPLSNSQTLYIPVSNLPNTDLSLRPELLPVLSSANLQLSDLVTLSDLPAPASLLSRLPPENTKWILVDHNAFQADLGKLYSTRVVGCIDHHEEEYFVPLAEKCEGEPRIVRKSGSCASLVVEYCRGAWDALSSEKTDEMKLWNSDLAKLALAPVLIDTNCLTSESKTTAADVQAVEYLESWIRANEGEKYYREGYFKEITSAKEDILFLSLPDILRKDYKQWTASASMKLGVSSIVKNVRSLMQKAGGEKAFLNMVRKFAEERELSIVSIMTTSHVDGVFRRELLVWALDAKGVKAAKRFEVDSREKLGLQKWGEGSLGLEDEKQWRRCWWQHRVDNSRKQVAPLLRSSIEETA